MKEIKKEIRFRRIERQTLAVLIIFILASYAYNFIVEPKLAKQTTSLKIEDLVSKDIDTIQSVINQLDNKNKKPKKSFKKRKLKYVSFDPNKTDSLTWIQLGLKSYTVSNILKYQKKGGQFYTCTDLKKIYSLENETYNNILPYCAIKPKPQKQRFQKTYKPKYDKPKPEYKKSKPRPLVDINKADTSEFKSLYGIGTILAKRIVNFRNGLGGFHSLEQLTEVYGIDPIVLEDNKKRLTISGKVQKLNLNVVLDSIVKHPNIDWPTGKVIVNYRKQHGDYQKPEDILKTKIISDSLYEKLLPYLDVEK